MTKYLTIFFYVCILSRLSFAAGFLHTQGQDIVDESGQKIMLRGVGLGNWLLPEGYMWRFGDDANRPRTIEKLISSLIGPDNAAKFWHDYRRNYVNADDIKQIAALGFNSVRPALNARLFLTEGDHPVYVDEGFELLDTLIQNCKANNIYVIIDMHAAPGGQTGHNIDDSVADQPVLFMDSRNQDRLVDLWVKIAEKYKDEPTVAAYDLLNEPLPTRTGAEAKFKDKLEPLYKRITQAIRQVDQKHMITVEGSDWANNWSAFTQPFDSNQVYQFHYYCWDNPTNLKSIKQYIDDRAKWNAPVWVGETGERDATIYWGTTEQFETLNMGWSFWPWKKMSASNGLYSIKPPANWGLIRGMTQPSMSPKPSPEVAQKAFDELLENIKIQNCTLSQEDLNALFHRVPGKVEAENYGHQGLNKAYFVKDTTKLSQFYRKDEPVQIEQGEQPAGQVVHLNADEWTAYQANSLDAKSYAATIRVKPTTAPATIEISVNDSVQRINVDDSDWSEISLKPVDFVKGSNQIKLGVKSGSALIDWMLFQ